MKGFMRFFTNKEVGIILGYLLAMAVVPGMGIVAGVHLIVLALMKKGEWYFKGLVYFSILKHLNPIFHPPSTSLFLLFMLILFVLFVIQTISISKIRFFVVEKKFYLLFLLFALASILGSLYTSMSLIRIAIVWIFIFVVFQALRRIGDLNLFTFLLRLATIMIVTSFPLIFTRMGYLGGTEFFKGIINHSQDFALILLPLFMVYLIGVLSHKIPSSLFHIVLLILGFVELVLSSSRAAVGGVVVSYAFYTLFRHRKKVKIKSLILFLLVIAGLITVVALNPEKVEEKISSFFIKYKNTGGVDNYDDSIASRVYLLEVAKQNVVEYPFTGVGFNVQTYYQDPLVRLNLDKLIKYIPGTEIMYSRPLEKGNLYASVFEENGLIAGFYFLFLLLYILWICYRSGIAYTWVPLVAMMFNFMGEASLFSPSGPGNFQMLIIGTLYMIVLRQYTKGRNVNV